MTGSPDDTEKVGMVITALPRLADISGVDIFSATGVMVLATTEAVLVSNTKVGDMTATVAFDKNTDTLLSSFSDCDTTTLGISYRPIIVLVSRTCL